MLDFLNPFSAYWKKRRFDSASLRKLEAKIKNYYLKARYEAAQTTDRNEAHWALSDGYSPVESLTPEVRKKIRTRARYEARENNSYANGICHTLVHEIIGRGPTIQFPDLSLEDSVKIQRAFRQWMTDNCMYDKVRSLALAEIIEGEGLGVFVNRESSINPVKLDLQILECDYMEPSYLNSYDYPDAVDVDEYGVPVRYHILDEHPGSGTYSNDGHWYDAEQIMHLFRQERAGQVRGVSRLAPCLNLFALLRRFTLATVEAAESAASFAGILYSDPDPNGAASLGEDEWFDAIPMIHRALMTLPRGWKMSQLRAEHPASTYAEFKRELLNEICRCLGLPLNLALANSSGYNYSSGRLDHLTFYNMAAIEQQRYEKTIFDRIFRMWYTEAHLLGDNTVPKKVKPEKLLWTWAWDRARSADPLKEAMADKEKLAACMMTYAQYYAQHGKNWEEEFAQIAKERKFLLENEIQVDIIPPLMQEDPNDPNAEGEAPAEEAPDPEAKASLHKWTTNRLAAFNHILNNAKP